MISFLKSLSDETRLKIVLILEKGEFSVMEITRVLAMGQSRVSRHLKILAESGVVRWRREGAWVFYSLNPLEGDKGLVMDGVLSWLHGEAKTFYPGLDDSIRMILEWRAGRSKKFFAGKWSEWDQLMERYIDRERFFGIIRREIGEVESLADLGCGNGNGIVQIYDLARHIIGVDNSPEMLRAARENMRRHAVSHVDIRLGDLEHLPIGDGEIDCALASMVLHHLARPPEIFREIIRILKPGGKIIVVDFEAHHNEKLRKEMADLWLGFTKEDMKRWMARWGFHRVRIRTEKSNVEDMNIMIATGRKINGKETKDEGKL